MHLETEEKNIRCFYLKVFSSEETRGKRAAKRSNKVNRSCGGSGVCGNRHWLECTQYYIILYGILNVISDASGSATLGVLLKLPFHFLRAVMKVRQETTTQTSINHSFGDSSKPSDKTSPSGPTHQCTKASLMWSAPQ